MFFPVYKERHEVKSLLNGEKNTVLPHNIDWFQVNVRPKTHNYQPKIFIFPLKIHIK